ncbi:MAG: hypothetical protein M1838_001415 [Thelocarpon superellum]|nr:MAG: hypothetical protein M1838_001415 [Thelocarpon superellum]
MGDADITASQWRLVQVGRVVLFANGPHEGKLGVVVEIVDHKRVLVDGPSSKHESVVPRHTLALSNVVLTPIVIEKLPRGARTGTVKKAWESADVEKKWDQSAWAKKREQKVRRRGLSDFDRFKVMRLRKQVCILSGSIAESRLVARQGKPLCLDMSREVLQLE